MSKLTKKQKEKLIEIEKLECRYLKKYYHFLKFAEDELLYGFKTKSKIENDWIDKYKSGISDFAVGAERIVYSLLNGKGIGQPNSAPVGADLFFEVQDAFIHIDLKTTGATLKEIKGNKEKGIKPWNNNIGDFVKSIPVGENQNSYKSEIKKANGTSFKPIRNYKPSLPFYYNKGKSNEKPCLSYFITILYDKDTLDVLIIAIMSMPNGGLERIYNSTVLSAGKNIGETRFNFSLVPNFELLPNDEKRIKVVYFDKNMNDTYKKKVKFFKELYINQ